MKKEKSQKINPSMKNQQELRPRSYSPKAYLGCDTCKCKYNDLKKNTSTSKLSVCSNSQEKTKAKKISEKQDQNVRSEKIKLTDLCNEDKRRIVELIEELSRVAEKNTQLMEALARSEKDCKEQQEYIKKQSNLHVDEKNFYINEINGHKNRIEYLENELKNQLAQWKNENRQKVNEVTALGKALQKSLEEKNELQEQINHLRICLKHSLESFQKLRSELTFLQSQSRKKNKSVTCQTEKLTLENVFPVTDEETEEESCSSTNTNKVVNAKSSLDIINDKLEYVYLLLKKKSETLMRNNSKKSDTDLSIYLKNENKLNSEKREEDFHTNVPVDVPIMVDSDEDKSGGTYKFLKPFDQCSKTSVQAQRILKTIGKPLSVILGETSKKLENSNVDNILKSEDSLTSNPCSNFLQNRIIQKNNLFKLAKEHQYTEDRLLEDLFYSDQPFNFASDTKSK